MLELRTAILRSTGNIYSTVLFDKESFANRKLKTELSWLDRGEAMRKLKKLLPWQENRLYLEL